MRRYNSLLLHVNKNLFLMTQGSTLIRRNVILKVVLTGRETGGRGHLWTTITFQVPHLLEKERAIVDKY